MLLGDSNRSLLFSRSTAKFIVFLSQPLTVKKYAFYSVYNTPCRIIRDFNSSV